MASTSRPALFLDRDGVINEEIGYLHRFEDVRFVPGAADLIRTANTLGLPVIVITNQAGIGRGFYTEAQFHSLMQSMRDALAQHHAHLTAVYFSPFHPEHGLGDYRRDTECRKPRPGMLLQAAREHGLDLSASALVGDRCSDIEAGAAAGVPHRFLIHGTEPEPCTCASYTPVQDLQTVTGWLLDHYGTKNPQTDPAEATEAANAHAIAS
ncbi:D-glycero-alpha-D-manno-heptose-1,7-bisphosphate 7-phosphatase [Terriglobus aquaticus]|uniref:D,D-heptose 1,7-bisphosphate phosphatase n=1 Tax=Terriglobus aquaticus TaxID=940139 RepID=A0ABW9KGN1_9BACT|nr:HAD family hydrolase [Terriglobus aquaticus]